LLISSTHDPITVAVLKTLGEIRIYVSLIGGQIVDTDQATSRNSSNVKTIALLLAVGVLFGCGADDPTDGERPEIRYVSLQHAQLSCIRDTRSGLIWELKADQEGLHNWRNTYSWFNPTQAHRELDYRGTADAGGCDGSQCDTWMFVVAVNEEEYCGFDDWRMPSKDEMFSISDLQKGKSPPTIDVESFPFAQAAEYWSANDYSFQPDAAWVWSFQHGHDRVDWKKSPKFVRLVRGVATDLPAVKE
jgi:hypothetical protein